MNVNTDDPSQDRGRSQLKHQRARAERALEIVSQALDVAPDALLRNGQSKKQFFDLQTANLWHTLSGGRAAVDPESYRRALMITSVWFFNETPPRDRMRAFVADVEKVMPRARAIAREADRDRVLRAIDAALGVGYLQVVSMIVAEAPDAVIGTVFEAMLPLMGLAMPSAGKPAVGGAE